MNQVIRWSFFVIGLMFFSMGIAMAINVQHLGIHPWDVLNVALFNRVGLSVGSWTIICGIILIIVSLLLDRRYVRIGTFLNAFIVGLFVDIYMWLDFLPKATHTWTDMVIILIAIIVMGISGGLYNAAAVGSGPRDGFMLSIADKTGASIGRVRIITESSVLALGWVLGGPVFIFTFIFTFIQSPLFEKSYLYFQQQIDKWTKSSPLNFEGEKRQV